MGKITSIVVFALIILSVVGYLIVGRLSDTVTVKNEEDAPNGTVVEVPETAVTPTPEPVAEPEPVNEKETVIGMSVDGHDITAYHYGTGDTELLFVGGIHGGYSWNTVLVAYELMEYLEKNPSVVPENVKVTVIPVLNPDGLDTVVDTTGKFSPEDVPSTSGATIPGRFNGNDVDLNRNFDCDWQATGKWQSRDVSGGSEPFSEPESEAIRAYVEAHRPSAAVVWYSSAGGVYASNCHNGVLPETRALLATYANASQYAPHESFDFYTITGDMVNWLAKEKIPAISVLLTNHEDTEWEKNRAGVEALLKQYAE